MNGFLNLNKPEGVSSRTVVDRVVEWFPGVKAGHGGTLDPLAEGVLVVALGQGARLIPFIQEQPKVYESTWELGATSPTDDRDGTITRQPVAQPPSAELVRALLARFVGVVEQVPPTFSAARVSGQRAYKLARRGTPVDLESRPVRIDRLECRRYEFPWLEVEVACGKGTYIRALARDVGQALDCGACVQRLIRTAVGPFRLAETLPWDADAETARKHVRPLLAAVEHLPRLTLSAEMLWRLRHGQKPVSPPDLAGWVAVLDDDGQLSVLAEARVAERQLVPRMVFQSDS